MLNVDTLNMGELLSGVAKLMQQQSTTSNASNTTSASLIDIPTQSHLVVEKEVKTF